MLRGAAEMSPGRYGSTRTGHGRSAELIPLCRLSYVVSMFNQVAEQILLSIHL